MCTISPYPFHHSSGTIHFTISTFNLFTIIPQFHINETKQLSLEQQVIAIELFGSCGSYKGDSEEDVGEKNEYGQELKKEKEVEEEVDIDEDEDEDEDKDEDEYEDEDED